MDIPMTTLSWGFSRICEITRESSTIESQARGLQGRANPTKSEAKQGSQDI